MMKKIAIILVVIVIGWSSHVIADGTVRFGIDLADIPEASGQPGSGGKGFMWMGWTIFDSLIYWNLNQSQTLPKHVPSLAEEYFVRPENKSKWVFKLRRGVKFHDGSDFNADAVIWNIEKLYKKDAPQYSLRQVGFNIAQQMGDISWRKIDNYTVEIDTGTPNSFSLYGFPYLRMASPTQWEKTKSWEEFVKHPSGTGPFMVQEIVPRERAVLVRNPNYWDKKRIPKVEKLIIRPIPDHNTRVTALLSGEVDIIETPPANMIPRLNQAGFKIIKSDYPHIWPYWFRIIGENTPLSNLWVRQALNLAINRDAIVNLLGGNAVAAKGQVLPDSPWFGNPSFKLRYDPAEAKRLLARSGYGPGNPLKLTMIISAGGSGQLEPLPMNEYIQQNLKDIGIQLDFKIVEWQTLRAMRNKGPLDPSNRDVHGHNNSWETSTPSNAFAQLFASSKIAPDGVNWGVQNPRGKAGRL